MAAGELFDRFLAPHQRQLIADALCQGDLRAARSLVMLVALGHDCGKCTPLFQSLDPDGYLATGASPFAGVDSSGRISHADAGALHFWRWLERQGVATSLAREIAGVVAGHHGHYPSDLVEKPVATGSSRWVERRDELLDAATFTVLGAADLSHVVATLAASATRPRSVALTVMTGLVITADWLVSDTQRFIDVDEAPAHDDALPAWVDRQLPRILARIEWCGLLGSPMPGRSMAEQFPNIPGFEPRGIQRKVISDLSTRGPGLYLLMDRAGGGKTEGVLHLASRLSASTGAPGFLLALPTMATTDAMVDRCVTFSQHAFAEATQLTVMHSLASLNPSAQALIAPSDDVSGYLNDQCDGENDGLVSVSEWLLGRRLGLLAANTVCTIDQILAVAIAARWQPLPFAGLSRKVIVIDEIHAYDEHMQTLTHHLLAWLAAAGASVVAMSATLPAIVARELANAFGEGLGVALSGAVPEPLPYPGWLHVSPDGTLTSGTAEPDATHHTTVQLTPYSPDDEGHESLGTAALDATRDVLDGADGNVLVLVNTVRGAIAVYERLNGQAKDVGVELFHARFPNGVRADKSQRLIAHYGKDSATRPARSIVVATQVAEQSLDVDFDRVVTELAPMSSLVQRDGRLHRHERPRPHCCSERLMVVLAPVVANELSPRDQAPYDAADLWATWRVLRSRAQNDVFTLHVPQDVPTLMEHVHNPERWVDDMGEQIALAEQRARNDVKARVGREKAIPMPRSVSSMADLTRQGLADPDFATRYDMNQRTVLPVARDTDGAWHLSTPDGPLVPESPTTDSIRLVIEHAIAIASPNRAMDEAMDQLTPAARTEAADPSGLPNDAWSKSGLLRHLVVMETRSPSAETLLQTSGRYDARHAKVGSGCITFDPILGCQAHPHHQEPDS